MLYGGRGWRTDGCHVGERDRGCCEVICIMWDGKLPSNVFVMLDPLPWPLPSDSGLNAFKCAGCSHSSRYLIHQFMTFYRPDPWWKCKHSHSEIKSTLGTSKSWLRVPTRKGGSSNTHGPRTALGSKLLTCVFIFVWVVRGCYQRYQISRNMVVTGLHPFDHQKYTQFPLLNYWPISSRHVKWYCSCTHQKIVVLLLLTKDQNIYLGIAEVLPDSSTIWLEQVPC